MAKQCKHCPWRKDVVPEQDIPNGYCQTAHANLQSTIAPEDASTQVGLLGTPIRMMACHETQPGAEKPCVGWVYNQLGTGNNIMLRLRALSDPSLSNPQVVGEQHATFAETLPQGDPK